MNAEQGSPAGIGRFGNSLVTTSYITGENLFLTLANSTVGNYSYTWDANKNKTAETITGAMSDYGFTTPSGYDDEDRLVAWERDDAAQDLSWTLSDVGDWDAYTVNTVTQNRTHNAVHELTAIDSNSLTYDSRGNLTQDHQGRQFAFANTNGMMASTTRNTATGGFDATYKYDLLGRRVAKQVDEDSGPFTVVRYTIFVPAVALLPESTRGGGQVAAEYEAEDAGSWSLAKTFTYGTYVDEPLTMTDYTAAGSTGAGTAEIFTYHAGRTYNISGLTNASGNLAEAYAFQPYGGVDVFDGSLMPISATALGNQYLFTARRFDGETGLYYFRARYYHLLLRRFLSRDPLDYSRTLPNLYTYVENSPLAHVDPSGEIPVIIPAIVIGCILFCDPQPVNAPGPDDDLLPHEPADGLQAGAISGVILGAAFHCWQWFTQPPPPPPAPRPLDFELHKELRDLQEMQKQVPKGSPAWEKLQDMIDDVIRQIWG